MSTRIYEAWRVKSDALSRISLYQMENEGAEVRDIKEEVDIPCYHCGYDKIIKHTDTLYQCEFCRKFNWK